MNTYAYVNGNPIQYYDPEGTIAAGGAGIAAVIAAAARAAAYICTKNPKVCKALQECIRNPKKCKENFCKQKPNRVYHGEEGKRGVCDIPGCKETDSTTTAQFKKSAAITCIALREFVSYACHNGKMDKSHQRELDIAKGKVKSCDGRCWF